MLNIMLINLSPLTTLGVQTALSSLEQADVEHVEELDRASLMASNGEVDLVILDLYQPRLDDGLRLCKQIKRCGAAPFVLALSELRDKHDLMYCYLAGVDSFVSTHEHPDRLLSAVRSTLGGRREWILGASGGHTRDDTGSTAGLTPREVEVLWMVRGRCTNGQIGTALHISPNTVKNHVAAILRKLGARRRSDLFSGYVQVS